MVRILNRSREETVDLVRKGTVRVVVVGLGHVGLPLAVLFADQGADVVGCVRTNKSAERINRGETSILEFDYYGLLKEGAEMLQPLCPNCGVRLFKLNGETFCPYCGRVAEITDFGVHIKDESASSYRRVVEKSQSLKNLLQKALSKGRLRATTETAEAVKEADVILVTVGSPVDENKKPDYSDITKACHELGKGLQKNALTVFKSTVSPGTTENLVKSILEKESGLKAGLDFGLAYMPETIYEGHALTNLRTLPKIVGGITLRCAEAAANVFSIFPAPIYIYDNPTIVEAAKLFMNIYRDVNIALANELALVCEKLGIDVIKAINAANTEQKTHILTPGLVGGYCLPKDTYHLTHPAEKTGYTPRLIKLARQLNDEMPNHVLELVDKAFEKMKIPIRGSKIAVLGLGFKANSGNLRNTPAKPIVLGLLRRGAKILAHDPYTDFSEFQEKVAKVECTRKIEEAVQKARCLVIVTDHFVYKRMPLSHIAELMDVPRAVVDARHLVDPAEAESLNMVFEGLGKP